MNALALFAPTSRIPTFHKKKAVAATIIATHKTEITVARLNLIGITVVVSQM